MFTIVIAVLPQYLWLIRTNNTVKNIRTPFVFKPPTGHQELTKCLSMVNQLDAPVYQIYFYFGMTLYMFRTVFPFIISSSRLYIQLSDRYCCLLLASRQQYLFDICLLLYVQSSTPDGRQKDHPKHVVSFQNKNKFDTLVHLVGYTYSMVQSPSWEAIWFAGSQEIPRISRNPKVHYRTHKRPPPVWLCYRNNISMHGPMKIKFTKFQ